MLRVWTCIRHMTKFVEKKCGGCCMSVELKVMNERTTERKVKLRDGNERRMSKLIKCYR